MTTNTELVGRLTAARLRELLDYDPESGVFTWRSSRRGVARAGARAGAFRSKGYRCIRVDGALILEHRAVFLWMTGELPSLQVDHINMVRADNRWANLRLVTNFENQQNRPRKASGLPTGVRRLKSGRYAARTWLGGRVVSLGTHNTPEEAHAAYLSGTVHLHGAST